MWQLRLDMPGGFSEDVDIEEARTAKAGRSGVLIAEIRVHGRSVVVGHLRLPRLFD